MKKKIVLFLCVMGIMTVLTGCSSGSKEIYTPQNIQEKKAKKVSDKFVKKVQKEDYKDIKSYIYIPDSTFIKDDDVSWYIERSNLEDIVGMSKKQIVLTNMEKDNTVIDDSDNNNATTRKIPRIMKLYLFRIGIMIGKSICQISMYQIISIKQKKVLRRTLMESKLQVIT